MVRSLLAILYSAYLHMTNLRTDEFVFFLDLTKIDIEENKAIHSIPYIALNLPSLEFTNSPMLLHYPL